MNLKMLVFICLGFALTYVSKSVELMGDLAPVAKDGVSMERAIYHIAALVLLLAALASFISGGLCAWRSLRAR
jgi:hypothetical protein